MRVAVAGTTISPGIFESLELLGREQALARIDAALAPLISACSDKNPAEPSTSVDIP